jgi:hypothetical protein
MIVVSRGGDLTLGHAASGDPPPFGGPPTRHQQRNHLGRT